MVQIDIWNYKQENMNDIFHQFVRFRHDEFSSSICIKQVIDLTKLFLSMWF